MSDKAYHRCAYSQLWSTTALQLEHAIIEDDLEWNSYHNAIGNRALTNSTKLYVY